MKRQTPAAIAAELQREIKAQAARVAADIKAGRFVLGQRNNEKARARQVAYDKVSSMVATIKPPIAAWSHELGEAKLGLSCCVGQERLRGQEHEHVLAIAAGKLLVWFAPTGGAWQAIYFRGHDKLSTPASIPEGPEAVESLLETAYSILQAALELYREDRAKLLEAL